ncbi:MAG: hypothetical protein METHAR1v1_420008 [Methanothrix sp.]|jgi:hypothetical protein|nr:MAG: hypothetical protein METHAR1v1_420008 [Methanothrix sp.]
MSFKYDDGPLIGGPKKAVLAGDIVQSGGEECEAEAIFRRATTNLKAS